MTQAKHTPTPWVADFHGHIMAHGGTTNVASTWTTADDNYPDGRPYRANAAFICKAANMHHELIGLLIGLEASLSLDQGHFPAELAAIRAVIAKATVEQ